MFIPGYRLPISHIEVLNEIESEHHDDPATYTAVYDAIVAGIRRFSPTGSAPVKFVGLALEGEEDDYVSYFLNASNHNPPSTPVDIISFHHYASCSDRDGGVNNTSYEAFFPSGDDFVNAVTGIVAIRDALRPATLLDADEVGVILPDDNDGKWTSDAPGFAPIYWNAAASMYAYLFGRTAVVGLDILGESQLVGYPSVSFTRRSNGQPYTAPPQFPSVAMLNWTKGEPTARYWALKLLLEEFTAGAPAGTARVADTDLLVTTTATGPAPSATNPFCGSVENGDTLYLACADPGATINAIQFASYGTPTGACGSYAKGACDAANSTAIVTAACVGKNTCSVFAMTPVFGDPCCECARTRVEVPARAPSPPGGPPPPADTQAAPSRPPHSPPTPPLPPPPLRRRHGKVPQGAGDVHGVVGRLPARVRQRARVRAGVCREGGAGRAQGAARQHARVGAGRDRAGRDGRHVALRGRVHGLRAARVRAVGGRHAHARALCAGRAAPARRRVTRGGVSVSAWRGGVRRAWNAGAPGRRWWRRACKSREGGGWRGKSPRVRRHTL